MRLQPLEVESRREHAGCHPVRTLTRLRVEQGGVRRGAANLGQDRRHGNPLAHEVVDQLQEVTRLLARIRMEARDVHLVLLFLRELLLGRLRTRHLLVRALEDRAQLRSDRNGKDTDFDFTAFLQCYPITVYLDVPGRAAPMATPSTK